MGRRCRLLSAVRLHDAVRRRVALPLRSLLSLRPPLALGVCVALALVVGAAALVASGAWSVASFPLSPARLLRRGREAMEDGRLRVTLVNVVPWHFEVQRALLHHLSLLDAALPLSLHSYSHVEDAAEAGMQTPCMAPLNRVNRAHYGAQFVDPACLQAVVLYSEVGSRGPLFFSASSDRPAAAYGAAFLSRVCSEDALVLATFPQQHLALLQAVVERCFNASHRPRLSRFLLTVHHPEQAVQGPAWRLLERLLALPGVSLHLLALADHVSAELHRQLRTAAVWSAPSLRAVRERPLWVSTFVPVFPLPVAASACASASSPVRFVVPGKVGARDFPALFASLVDSGAAAAGDSVGYRVDFVGGYTALRPHALQPLSGLVSQSAFLSTSDFYGRCCQARALLTLFKGEDTPYHRNQSSSSVPLALITGVPLLTDALLPSLYTYLTPDMTLVKRPSESYAEALQRVATDPAAVERAREALHRRRGEVEAGNVRLLQHLLTEAAAQTVDGELPPWNSVRQVVPQSV